MSREISRREFLKIASAAMGLILLDGDWIAPERLPGFEVAWMVEIPTGVRAAQVTLLTSGPGSGSVGWLMLPLGADGGQLLDRRIEAEKRGWMRRTELGTATVKPGATHVVYVEGLPHGTEVFGALVSWNEDERERFVFNGATLMETKGGMFDVRNDVAVLTGKPSSSIM